MIKKILTFLLICLSMTGLQAQNWSGGGQRQMPTGKFYGKIVDESGSGVGYAAVKIYGVKFDTTAKQMVRTLVTGQLTESNGDFMLEGIPMMGKKTLEVQVLGFANFETEVAFDMPQPGGGSTGGRPNWAAMAAAMEKDLGNIALTSEALEVDEVTIEGQASAVTLALDRKIFKVDQNVVAAGGTGVDALRNVPSLSVDIDGNITLRNSSPQLFIDGRPTTLSLDQIPAESIESVEVITNPSARYDAGGGQGGIVNVVLKKERRIGYNGSVRAGIDSRLGYNAGLNLNAREGKVNFYVNGGLNQFNRVTEGTTNRENFFGTPLTNVLQETNTDFTGRFIRSRAGLDWFVDNRNTITLEGSYTQGQFSPVSTIGITTDSLYASGTTQSSAIRYSESTRKFENIGASLLFKHLFPQQGHEWTADLSLNQVTSNGDGIFSTEFLDTGISTSEKQSNGGGTQFLTLQTDYVKPLSDQIKIETGVRAALRSFDSENSNFVFSNIENDFVLVPTFADEYNYLDAVYAGYFIFNQEFGDWGYQAGLRAESSQYSGSLPLADPGEQEFAINYPISLFPSVFLTKNLNEQDQVQFSYSRRINRPSFFQLMPFTDFSDSLNLRRGNAELIPEFSNSLELTYQNILKEGHDFLVSAYYKQSNGLITAYQFTEFVEEVGREVVVSSYANANNSYAYGVEFTMRNTVLDRKLEFTHNINAYNSRVDGSNIEEGLVADQFTWFIKENINITLPWSMRLQLTGEYQSPAAFTPSSSGFNWRGVTNTAQGYRISYWYADAALSKRLFNNKANVSLAISDIFATRIRGQVSDSDLFYQESESIGNPRLVRLNFSYNFGKRDMSIFKRKNMNFNTNGMDMQ